MTRLLSAICGILVVVVAGWGTAQGEPQQNSAARRAAHRPRPPRPPADPENPDLAAASQNVPVNVPANFPAPAQAALVAPKPTPVSTPATEAVAQAVENFPPPTPAQVTYHDGLLTVQALNSTLGSLLIAIRNKTGIQFEGLEFGAPERVVVSMGPASEGEVLAAILGGSKFNYVVLDRPDSPGTVQRVLLTPRGGAAAVGGQPLRPANALGEGDDEDAPEETSGDPEPQDTPVRPPVTQVQPPQPQPDQPPKTPEQLMQQLIQMQQKQQQMQQQQLQSPPNQAPIKQAPIPQ